MKKNKVKSLEEILGSDFGDVSRIDSPDWNHTNRCYDWKNYVDDEFKSRWDELTYRERLIIAVFAERLASKEEWD